MASKGNVPRDGPGCSGPLSEAVARLLFWKDKLMTVVVDHLRCFSDSSKVSHEYWLPQVLSILLERRKSCTKTQDTKVVGPNPDAGKIFISREISM